MEYQKFDTNSVNLIERMSAEVTKNAVPSLRWGTAKVGNAMQFPIFSFFQFAETANWRVEAELVRIKCAAKIPGILRFNPFTSTHTQFGVVVYFFSEMKKIISESESFEVAKNHYTTLVAYLAVAGNE